MSALRVSALRVSALRGLDLEIGELEELGSERILEQTDRLIRGL